MTVVPVDRSHNLLRTPKGDSPLDSYWTVNKLIKEFDLKLDPCCTGPDDCLVPTEQGGIFFTPKDDGLKQEWKYNSIFNPPFSKISLDKNDEPRYNGDRQIIYTPCIYEWCEKAIFEAIKHNTVNVGILPWYNSDWFRDCVWGPLPKSNIIPLDKRINFLDENNEPIVGNRFDSFLAVWDQRKR